MVTWPTMSRSGAGGALMTSHQALGGVAYDALGDQPGAVVTAHWNKWDSRAGGHVQDQQLRRQVIAQRREPFVQSVLQVQVQMGVGESACRGRAHDDRATTGVVDTRDHLLRTIEAVARRCDDEHCRTRTPFERQEILEVCPLLKILSDAVDWHLLVKLGCGVLRGATTRSSADGPDGIDVTEFGAQAHDRWLDALGDGTL